MKRTCGPNNKTSTFFDSSWLSASDAETAKMSASTPFSSAAYCIFVPNKLVLIPAEQTSMIVLFSILNTSFSSSYIFI